LIKVEASRERHGWDPPRGTGVGALESEEVVAAIRTSVGVDGVRSRVLGVRDVSVERLELVLNILGAGGKVNVDTSPSAVVRRLAVVLPFDLELLASVCRG